MNIEDGIRVLLWMMNVNRNLARRHCEEDEGYIIKFKERRMLMKNQQQIDMNL